MGCKPKREVIVGLQSGATIMYLSKVFIILSMLDNSKFLPFALFFKFSLMFFYQTCHTTILFLRQKWSKNHQNRSVSATQFPTAQKQFLKGFAIYDYSFCSTFAGDRILSLISMVLNRPSLHDGHWKISKPLSRRIRSCTVSFFGLIVIFLSAFLFKAL